MTTKTVVTKTSFAEVFLRRISNIEARANKAGITITHVCRDSGIARATPDRWRKKVPNTIALIDKMEAVVAEAESKAAQAAQAAQAE